MKLFKHSSGTVVCFGFDMLERRPDAHKICWNDPSTGAWDVEANNLAGWVTAPTKISPEFIIEANGKIIAYQPGLCIEMIRIGAPLVWGVNFIGADTVHIVSQAA